MFIEGSCQGAVCWGVKIEGRGSLSVDNMRFKGLTGFFSHEHLGELLTLVSSPLFIVEEKGEGLGPGAKRFSSNCGDKIMGRSFLGFEGITDSKS